MLYNDLVDLFICIGIFVFIVNSMSIFVFKRFYV